MSLYPQPTLPGRPYVPMNGTPVAGEVGLDALPFTGGDLAVILVAALLLIVAGLLARKLAREGVR